jgi:hypothetical protein
LNDLATDCHAAIFTDVLVGSGDVPLIVKSDPQVISICAREVCLEEGAQIVIRECSSECTFIFIFMKVNIDLKVIAPSGDWVMVEPGDYPVRLRVTSTGVEQNGTPPSLSQEQLKQKSMLDFLQMEERLALLLQSEYPTISVSIWHFIREMTKNNSSLPLHKTATHPDTEGRLNKRAVALRDESGGTFIIPSCSFKKREADIHQYLKITGIDELVEEENKYDLGDSFYASVNPLQLVIQDRQRRIGLRAKSCYQILKKMKVSVPSL